MDSVLLIPLPFSEKAKLAEGGKIPRRFGLGVVNLMWLCEGGKADTGFFCLFFLYGGPWI